jgi:GH24 family phage-related lysozyme (muramidase)
MDPMTDVTPIYDSFRAALGGKITTAQFNAIKALLDSLNLSKDDTVVAPSPPPASTPVTAITARIMLEILEHEGLVREAYKDSVGVWTWGVGVTDNSGHKVARYKDAPTTILRALEVYEWLLRTKYLPDVLKAFDGFPLTEAQLGAALSFHWNTGAIGKASWVGMFRKGDMAGARNGFMAYNKPPEIIGRRKLEAALFFDGKWSGDGKTIVYTRVRKPSYAPDWGSAQLTDMREMVADVMARAGA